MERSSRMFFVNIGTQCADSNSVMRTALELTKIYDSVDKCIPSILTDEQSERCA